MRATRQPRFWPAAALLATAACATTPERPEPGPGPSLETSVGRIAERLVHAAELRTDLRSVRTRIDAIEPEQGTASLLAANEGERIGTVLRRELMLVLVDEMYLVDADADPGARAPLGEAADAPPAATHRLVGDYVCAGDDLYLSMRLVDARTRVILAAARGPIPLAALGDLSQPESRVAAGTTPALGAAAILTAGSAPGGAPAGASGSPGPALTQAGEPRFLDGPASAQEAPAPPPVEKDFQAWRARRLAQQGTASGERILPAAEDPAAIAESLEEWRRRKLADRSATPTPATPVQPQAAPGTAAGAPPRYPWRTPELDRILGIPAGPSTAPGAEERPWRTRELAEILGVPPGK